ncbi:MAG: PilZ domain-containing protein [Burkholderiales bacterium]|jgi:type IV pilus assembly protein PilZ|nr:PilZ domain-containing protein [Burkholderiales bacterium]
MSEQVAPRGVVLPVNILSRSSLYAAYMSFVKGGALFVPTNNKHSLGEEVFLLLMIKDVPEKLPVQGKIIWVTPETLQAGRIKGIGVQFADNDAGHKAQKTIEKILGRHLASDRPTHTL